MVHRSAQALLRFLRSHPIPRQLTTIFDASPVLSQAEDTALQTPVV